MTNRRAFTLWASAVTWALVGYLVLLGIPALFVAVAVLTPLVVPPEAWRAMVLYVHLPLLFLAWIPVRALFVRLPPAEGLALGRDEAPALAQLLRELTGVMKAPRVSEVILSADLNASIAQRPRLGVFGPYRNTLVIGLPLLMALTADELRAVLAHELGHISRNHGRLGAWLYRLAQTWDRFLEGLELEGRRSAGLFRPFFRWYLPRFERASLALRRERELLTDRTAAEAASAAVQASALMRSAIADRFLAERCWPEIEALVAESPIPPAAFARLAVRLPWACAQEEAEPWRADALAAPPDEFTTHPSLAQRLRALGLDPAKVRATPPMVAVTAGAALFGSAFVEAVAAWDAKWQAEVAGAWAAEHERVREGQRILDEVEHSADWRELEPEDLRDYAHLLARLRGESEALPLWRRLLELAPGDPVALFAIGSSLAANDDPSAATYLVRSANADPGLAPLAFEALAGTLARQGRAVEAMRYTRQAHEAATTLEEARRERSLVTRRDRLVSHDLPDDVLEAVRRVLDLPEIGRAYIARKKCRTLPDHFPVWVIGFVRRSERDEWRRSLGRLDEMLAEEIAPLLLGPAFVVDLLRDFHPMLRRFRRLKGACLIRHGRLGRPLAARTPYFAAAAVLCAGVLGVAAVLAPQGASDPAAPAVQPAEDGSSAADASRTAGKRTREGKPSRAHWRPPREQLVTEDVAIAEHAVLQPADMEGSWDEVPVSASQASGCAENKVDLSRLTVTGTARSAFRGSGAHIESRVKLFANAKQAAIFFDTTTNETVLACIRNGVERALRQAGLEPRVAYARLQTEPPIGLETGIYVIGFVVTLSDGSERDYPVDVLTFRVGRAVGAVFFSLIPSEDGSRPCPCELNEARLVASRLASA